MHNALSPLTIFSGFSCCSIFRVLCGVFQIIVCPFSVFLSIIVLAVLLLFTASLISSNLSSLKKTPLKIRICTLLIFYLSIKYTLTVNEFMITNILVLGSMVEQFLLCYWSVNYIQLLRSLSLLVLNKSDGIGILL